MKIVYKILYTIALFISVINKIYSNNIVNYTSILNSYKKNFQNLSKIPEKYISNKSNNLMSNIKSKEINSSNNINLNNKSFLKSESMQNVNHERYGHDSGIGPLITTTYPQSNFNNSNMLSILGWDVNNLLKKYNMYNSINNNLKASPIKEINRKLRLSSIKNKLNSVIDINEKKNLMVKLREKYTEVPLVHHMFYKKKYRMKERQNIYSSNINIFNNISQQLSFDGKVVPISLSILKDKIDPKFNVIKLLDDINLDKSTNLIVKGNDNKTYEMKIYFKGDPDKKEFYENYGNNPNLKSYYQGAENDFKKHRIILNRLYGLPDNSTKVIIKNKGQRGIQTSLYNLKEKNPFSNIDSDKDLIDNKSISKKSRTNQSINKQKLKNSKFRKSSSKTNIIIPKISKYSKPDTPRFEDVDFPQCLSQSTHDSGNYLLSSLYEMPNGNSLADRCFYEKSNFNKNCIYLISFISKAILRAFTILYEGNTFYPYNNLKASNVYLTYEANLKYVYLDRFILDDKTYDNTNNKPLKYDLNSLGDMLISLIIGNNNINDLFSLGNIDNAYDLYLKLQKYFKDKNINESILSSLNLNIFMLDDESTPKLLFYENFIEEFEKTVFDFIYRLKNVNVNTNFQFDDIKQALNHKFITQNISSTYDNKNYSYGLDNEKKILYNQVIDSNESNNSLVQDF